MKNIQITSHAKAFMKFYHLTTADRLDDILANGLDPAFSASSLQAIFLAGSAFTAQNYEGMKDGPTCLVEVELPDKPEKHGLNLGPDNYELRDLLDDKNFDFVQYGVTEGTRAEDCTWQQSLAICDQVACFSKIPAHLINPVKPEFITPTQEEILEILRKHPLVGLKEDVQRAFLVGSFAKEALGLGSTRPQSDVDILLEVTQRQGETESDITDRYRKKLMAHFMKHDIRGKKDAVHPQWLQRRVDLYITYDASCNPLPMVQLRPEKPEPRKHKTMKPG